MPRRKKEKPEKEETKTPEKEEKKKKKPKKEVYTDPYELLDEYLDEVITAIGIAYLGFQRDEFKEIIKDVFAGAVGQVKSKPKSKTIINRLNSARDSVMEAIAYNILKIKDLSSLTDDQLEFLVSNVKKGITSLGPRLYEESKKRNRGDLIEILRVNWNMYGILSPFTCPKCGFNAVMPDFSCRICGADVSMKEVKKQLDVKELLRGYSSIDMQGFKEILSSGYFYYKDGVVYPPSSSLQGMFFEIILSKDEKSSIANISDMPHHP
ncbi:hypothetical protein IC006_1132 [Sulfuracidifex tepidarius]|uniref:Uncharacterized protein n=1 Tax=Sulfuracidifex tepidarius TaxID=1294262 RepID=A0A510DUJ2_9CREN|nr:hypothetical protein [Sulfuracidifex tepidarius]BBG23837.1 hypothetical protein IC006_1132 [Sulfuracidifex tepidarius]